MTPLNGIRVIECGVAIAGPLAARYLAHLGAEVIKVDNRGESLVGTPWWAPPDIGPAGADLFTGTFHGNKRSLGLNLKAPEARPILERLLAASDVFITNLSVPAVESLRLTYADLRPINPRLVYIALPGFGSGPGPYRDYRSWGPNLSSLSGLDNMTGDPDRPPVMTPLPLPDYVGGYHAVAAIIRALLDRAATGDGQEIRMSQYETTVGVLGPQVLEQQLAGTAPNRTGNRNPVAAPRDLFPCRGDDRWVSIEVHADDEWQALAGIEGMPAAIRDPRFSTHAGRLAHQDEIDALIARWTRTLTDREAAAALRAAGVPAHPVQSAWDHLSDPHLEARGFWKLVGHDLLGADLLSDLPVRFSATPARVDHAGHSFGHNTRSILVDLARVPQAKADELLEKEIAQGPAPVPAHITSEMLQRPSRRWAWPLLRVLDHASEAPAVPAESPAPGAVPRELSACRVLDLSDELSAYGTYLLALMGADVIRVEPPGGAEIRLRPPFAGETSLYQQFVDAGKRSVTLDLESEEGRRSFAALARDADLIYESLPPGWLAERGLGWEELRALNPGLSLVSVTPFGQSGPYHTLKARELGLWALSSTLPLTGYPDRRPLIPGASLANTLIGTNGAIAALAALYAREAIGRGQQVEVSGQEVLIFSGGAMLSQIDDLAQRRRTGVRALGSAPWAFFQCRDRMISLLALFPSHWKTLANWIYEETGNEAALDPKYEGVPAVRGRHVEEVEALVSSLTALHDAGEFCAEAQRRGVPAMPVSSVADLLDDAHLAATGFWQDLDLPGLGPVRLPGPPFRLGGMAPLRPAPALGQHTAELLAPVGA